MTTLQNKVALVTGASRGIGRATALALAAAGARVLVHYGRSAQEADAVASAIKATGGHADTVSADLGTPDGPALLAKQVRSIVGDRLDVLVLNAGVSKASTIADYTVPDFDNLFATNVRGTFFLVQQLLPLLGEGSSVVVTSSIGARSVVGKPGLENPSILAYASTKGALETLVRNWAYILGPSVCCEPRATAPKAGKRTIEADAALPVHLLMAVFAQAPKTTCRNLIILSSNHCGQRYRSFVSLPYLYTLPPDILK